MKNLMLNILLVEDDEADVMNVQQAFRSGHITNPLYIANDGIAALAMLRGEPGQSPVIPAERRIILLDLNLPQMTGLEFLQQLRADPTIAHIPVVVVAASKQERDLIGAYGFNVAGYIQKTVNFNIFTELLVTFNDYWTSCELS
ncbi:response regulator [Chamaesiphon sp.]|uniref:response regulator n=1 Tax=Chamaesiphon sp. TaxID=2814140 RepID=UPI0035941400